MDREGISSFECVTSGCYSGFLVMSELLLLRCSMDILAMTGMKERDCRGHTLFFLDVVLRVCLFEHFVNVDLHDTFAAGYCIR